MKAQLLCERPTLRTPLARNGTRQAGMVHCQTAGSHSISKKTAAPRAPLSEYSQAAKEPAVTLRYYFLLALMRAVTLSMDFSDFLPGTFAYWPARSTPSLPTKELEPKKLTHSAQALPALIGDDSSKSIE